MADPTEVVYKDYAEWLNGYPIGYHDHWIHGHSAHQFDDCGKADCWYCIIWRPYDNWVHPAIAALSPQEAAADERKEGENR